MASTYPTSLDSFTNPLATNPLTSPSHAQQHSDLNDAMEAVQTKLAIGNTVIGTYTAYTPTFTNLTVGNGTLTSSYARVNNFVHYFGKIVFGSTTAITGGVSVSLPINLDADMAGTTAQQFGPVSYRDVSGIVTFIGNGRVSTGSATTAILEVLAAGATYAQNAPISSTIPMTWATSDNLAWNFYYKAA
jgi:hypothetical protein